jgi:hypothetical protein
MSPWVLVRKVDYGPGAGESGGLGALRHKGVSVATGWGQRGASCCPKKGLGATFTVLNSNGLNCAAVMSD